MPADLPEYCYNTSAHSASGTTPFEVVYGRPPPSLHSFLPSEIRAQAVVDSLRSRDETLTLLRQHLLRVQQRMAASANKHRRDVEYAGDLVYLKFRPYRQSSLFPAPNRKQAPRYYGPYSVEARIGEAAYHLKLPDGSRIHPVFHVSLLKLVIGSAAPDSELPEALTDAEPPLLPEKVLGERMVTRDESRIPQLLIKWSGQLVDEATWVDTADLQGQFPYLRLAGKAVSPTRAVDTSWRVYKRGNRQVLWPTESEEKGEE